mgnify:CR=1 FL=1
MTAELPPGIGLRTRLDGTELRLDLFYDAEWEQRPVFPLRRKVGERGSANARLLVAQADGKRDRLLFRRVERDKRILDANIRRSCPLPMRSRR